MSDRETKNTFESKWWYRLGKVIKWSILLMAFLSSFADYEYTAYSYEVYLLAFVYGYAAFILISFFWLLVRYIVFGYGLRLDKKSFAAGGKAIGRVTFVFLIISLGFLLIVTLPEYIDRLQKKEIQPTTSEINPFREIKDEALELGRFRIVYDKQYVAKEPIRTYHDASFNRPSEVIRSGDTFYFDLRALIDNQKSIPVRTVVVEPLGISGEYYRDYTDGYIKSENLVLIEDELSRLKATAHPFKNYKYAPDCPPNSNRIGDGDLCLCKPKYRLDLSIYDCIDWPWEYLE